MGSGSIYVVNNWDFMFWAVLCLTAGLGFGGLSNDRLGCDSLDFVMKGWTGT